MKLQIFRIAILSCMLFLASFESKAAAEFTWINNSGCALTITFKNSLNAVIYTTSTSGGPAVCLTGINTIEITDACGGLWIYNACGVLSAPPSGTPCACSWIPNWGGSCGPAGGLCGPGSTLLTLNI